MRVSKTTHDRGGGGCCCCWCRLSILAISTFVSFSLSAKVITLMLRPLVGAGTNSIFVWHSGCRMMFAYGITQFPISLCFVLVNYEITTHYFHDENMWVFDECPLPTFPSFIRSFGSYVVQYGFGLFWVFSVPAAVVVVVGFGACSILPTTANCILVYV